MSEIRANDYVRDKFGRIGRVLCRCNGYGFGCKPVDDGPIAVVAMADGDWKVLAIFELLRVFS